MRAYINFVGHRASSLALAKTSLLIVRRRMLARRVVRRGASLIEVLVVLAIINILFVLILAGTQAVREVANKAKCGSNLKQIGLALHQYHDVHRCFPIANLPRKHWGWQATLLPFVEQEQLYAVINFDDAWRGCWDSLAAEKIYGMPSIAGRRLELLVCPSDPNAGASASDASTGVRDPLFLLGSYMGVSGSQVKVPLSCGRTDASRDGMLFGHYVDPVNPSCSRFFPAVPTSFRHVTDGAAQTLFVGERGVPGNNYFGWVFCGTGYNLAGEGDQVLSVGFGFYPDSANSPRELTPGIPENAQHYWSYHATGGNFLFVDGSVKFLPYSISLDVLRALATRSGGDGVGSY